MSYIISAYTTDAFKEYNLPSLNNSDYVLNVRRSQLGLPADLKISMEVVDNIWTIKGGQDYSLYIAGQRYDDADLSDGLIELMIIKDIPRRKFVALFPKYKAGKVFNMKGSKSLVSYTQARNIFIEPMLGHTMKFVGDGEIFETGAIRVDILHNAIRALML